MSEPLIGKLDQVGYVPAFVVDSVTSACTFYKRYKGQPYELMVHKPEAWKKYCKVAANPYTTKEYDWWLFDYCFKDAIE